MRRCCRVLLRAAAARDSVAQGVAAGSAQGAAAGCKVLRQSAVESCLPAFPEGFLLAIISRWRGTER